MDADRFESFLRSLSASPSRRSALHLLAGLVLGGPLALGVAGTEAHNALKKCKKIEDKDKRKQCIKKAKKHNATHATPGCTPNCTNKECGDNGCGGSCGQCASGRTCCSNLCVDIQGSLDCCNSPCPVPACQSCQSGNCVDVNQGQTCATLEIKGELVSQRCCDGACPDPPCTPSGATGQPCEVPEDCDGFSCCGKPVECRVDTGPGLECFCPHSLAGEPCGSDWDCIVRNTEATACICGTCQEPL